jgi:hypothetical protein
MKTLVLAAALVFAFAAPVTTAPASAAVAAPVPQHGWPLLLSGLAAALWVARRRLNHTL